MTQQWDLILKQHLEANPQAFATWLVPGAWVERTLKAEFSVERHADGLMQVIVEGQPALLHLEWQSVNDADMGRRLLEYNVLAALKNDHLPVISCVIYVRDVGKVQQPPFVVTFPTGKEMIRFHYICIELHKVPADTLLSAGSRGLLPLVFLAQRGKEPAIAGEAMERLVIAQDKDLLRLAYYLGELAFSGAHEREWFRKRFQMLQGWSEDHWLSDEIGQPYLEKGQKEMLLYLVQEWFPKLLPQAKEIISEVHDLSAVKDVTSKLRMAQDDAVAMNILAGLRGK